MKKPFPSTIVLLSFNEKTIPVNHSDVHKKNGIKSTERESKTISVNKSDIEMKNHFRQQ